MKTAVEWLENILHDFIHPEHGAEFFPFVEQAKSMEKEQILDAFIAGSEQVMKIWNEKEEASKDYFTETYRQ